MKIDSRILAVLNVLFLTLSVGAGVYLVSSSVDTQSQASLIHSLTLETTDEDVAPGERLAISVELDSERSPIDYVQATIEYDPAALRYISGSPGSYFAQDAAFALTQHSDNISVVYSQAADSQPVAGKASVALLIFERLTDDTTIVTVSPASRTSIQNDDNNYVQSFGELTIR